MLGAAAFRSGLPSGRRGRPGVFSVIHWASPAVVTHITAPATSSVLYRRDMGGLLGNGILTEVGHVPERMCHGNPCLVEPETICGSAARNVSCFPSRGQPQAQQKHAAANGDH